MNIYQSNTYRKDLLHFDDEPHVQDREQVKGRQSCISVLVPYLTIPSSIQGTSQNVATVFHGWPYGRFIEIHSHLRRKKLHRTNQGTNFLGGSFSNRDNVMAPIQFRRESHTQHLKRSFFLKNRAIHFHINSTSVIRPVKRNQLSFFSIEINRPLPAPVRSVSQIRFKFKSQFQLLPQIRCLITLRTESIIISIDSNVTDNIIMKVINLQ